MAYKGLDSVIETLKGSISFSWLSRAWGLADSITDMREEKPYVFPACYATTDGDPISMMPSDIWGAFCFWIRNGDAKFINPEYGQLPLVVYPVSLIFYMDISKIHSNYKETRSKITEDIFNYFYTIHGGCVLTPVKFIEDDITKVYEGFTLTDLDNKWKIYPRWCCRMDAEVTFRYVCYTTNLYA